MCCNLSAISFLLLIFKILGETAVLFYVSFNNSKQYCHTTYSKQYFFSSNLRSRVCIIEGKQLQFLNWATTGYCNNKHYCYYTNINSYYPSLGLPCHCTEMQLIFSFIHIEKSAWFPHGAAIIGGVRLLTHLSHEGEGFGSHCYRPATCGWQCTILAIIPFFLWLNSFVPDNFFSSVMQLVPSYPSFSIC